MRGSRNIYNKCRKSGTVNGSAGRKGGAKAQAVVVNSGIANACTGAEGFGYCKDTADAAAKALNISADGVLIGSTGVIGKQIPIDKLTAGIKVLAGKKNDTLEKWYRSSQSNYDNRYISKGTGRCN
mgnify:CR=1 FL=1